MLFTLFFVLFAVARAYFEVNLTGGVLDRLYIATIYVGNPPQPKNIQIDTGSGILIINCKQCSNCQTHPHPNPPFNRVESNTQQRVGCTPHQIFCESCNSTSQECLYKYGYYGQDWTSGILFRDLVSVTGDNSSAVSILLGCVTLESQGFANDTRLDGLWGLGKVGYSQNYTKLERVDTYVVQASKLAGSPRILSICLSFYGGKMVIGGVNNNLHTQPPITFNYDNQQTDSFATSLGQIKIGLSQVYQNGGQYMNNIMIDSGSTGSLLSKQFYDQIVNHMQYACSNLGERCEYFNESGPCVRLSDAYYLSAFPDIVLTLSGQDLAWKASQYLLLDSADSNDFCLFAQVSNTTFVLGNDFMINKDIVLGQKTITIYPQSICGTERPPYGQPVQSANTQPSSSALSVGFIVLIALGAVLLISMGVFLALYCRKMKQKEPVGSQEAKVQIQGVQVCPVTDVRLFGQQQAPQSQTQLQAQLQAPPNQLSPQVQPQPHSL